MSFAPNDVLVFSVQRLQKHLNTKHLYDYTADLTGIGDRSVHVTKDE